MFAGLILSLGGERNHRKTKVCVQLQVKGFNKKQKGQQGKKQNKLRRGIHKMATSACIPRVTATTKTNTCAYNTITYMHNETRQSGGSEWYKQTVMMENSWECDKWQVCGVKGNESRRKGDGDLWW